MKVAGTVHVSSSAAVELAGELTSQSRKFAMRAYTGEVVDLEGERMVFDLRGVEYDQTVPILRQHNPELIAGQSSSVVVTEDAILIEGDLYNQADCGREVALFSDQGFAWQASVGLDVLDALFLPAEETADVNGRTVEGPCVVVTRSQLKESSFVPLGADRNTSAVALSGSTSVQVQPMEQDMSKTASRKRRNAATARARRNKSNREALLAAGRALLMDEEKDEDEVEINLEGGAEEIPEAELLIPDENPEPDALPGELADDSDEDMEDDEEELEDEDGYPSEVSAAAAKFLRAFKGSEKFALLALSKGVKLSDAKRIHVQLENKRLKAKLAKLQAGSNVPAQRPSVAPVKHSGEPKRAAAGDFVAMARDLAKSKSLSLTDAMKELARENPTLHRTYKERTQ
jgi:hypothetical protein